MAPLDDTEVGLSEQEREVQATVHSFAEKVMRPAARALDRLDDPAEVVAPGSPLWDVRSQYQKLGLDALITPEGGLLGSADGDGAGSREGGMGPLERARLTGLVMEELAWGDVGLTITCTASASAFLQMAGDDELAERCGGPTGISCWALTEPDHGSDTVGFTEPHFTDGSLRPNCVATRDGDDYVIRGQKSAWVSLGSIATLCLLFCTVETERGFAGGGGFLIPLDLPGVRRPPPLDKLGQRTLNQGEIYFEDVRIPARWMVVPPDFYAQALEVMLSHGNSIMSTWFVGVARAAYDHAVAYAHERVQGGVPIFEHQSVKARLFEMFMKGEAARALSRRVAAYNALEMPKFHHCVAAKVFSTNTAFEVASAGVQIFGGNGLSREYPMEKLLRDARASLVEDGCNHVLGLMAGSRLTPNVW